MTIQHRRSQSGFTLLELLVVVALIAVMAAVSLPAIARFIRNYRIRSAVEEVKGDLQRARTTAIMKNVNLGVVFLVTSPTTYRFVVEDPLTPGDNNLRAPGPGVNLDAAFFDPAPANPNRTRIFPERTLPSGVVFASTNAECPAAALPPVGAAFAPNNFGVRFSRLGASCNPSGPVDTINTCPVVLPARTNVLMSTGGNTVVCVLDTTTGLSRTLLLGLTGQFQDQG